MSILEETDWKRRAAELAPRKGAFIDGAYREAMSGATFETVSPRDGAVLAQVAACGPEDVDAAVDAARRAVNDRRWLGKAPSERKLILLRFAELIRENKAQLALLDSIDMGKPIHDSFRRDTFATAECIQFYAEALDKVYGDIAPTGRNTLGLIHDEPLGVVGIVLPWNYPLLMAAWKIAPALAVGNSIVVKPAEQSPLSALCLAELALEAGIPAGVMNVVPGLGEVAGAALGRHMDIDKVAFTGSTEIGKLFLRYSGESNMKVVSLECGGKSPQIVCGDVVDIERTARSIASGIFTNQGQVCNAGSRLIVHRSIQEKLVDRVAELAQELRLGDPLDPKVTLGAVVDQTQLNRILSYVQAGREAGATVRYGGEQALGHSGGWYMQPTILESVTNNMQVAQEEIFGPVLSVITFDDLDEAVAAGNNTKYGLAAAIWTRDVNVAHIVARELHAGTVWVNCFDTSDMTVPFGGFKQSGFGRDKSVQALHEYTQRKTTWFEFDERAVPDR